VSFLDVYKDGGYTPHRAMPFRQQLGYQAPEAAFKSLIHEMEAQGETVGYLGI